MKMMLATGLGLALLSGAAYAGFTQPFDVDVDNAAMIANGDQVSARYAASPRSHIGCGVRKLLLSDGSIFTFGFCQAEDAAGDAILCQTENAGLLDAIASSGEYGFITFSWNAANECTRIGFSNQSFYLPKKLERN